MARVEVISLDEAFEKGRGPDKKKRKKREGIGESYVKEGIRAIKEDGLSLDEVSEKLHENVESEDLADQIMGRIKAAFAKGMVSLEALLEKGRGPDKQPRRKRYAHGYPEEEFPNAGKHAEERLSVHGGDKEKAINSLKEELFHLIRIKDYRKRNKSTLKI